LESTTKDIHHDLVALAAKGDRVAFRRLYELYSGAMYGTALRIMGNEQDAQDVLHDVFVELVDKLSKFKGGSTFGYWLKRVVINKSLNELRKMKKNTDIQLKEESSEAEMEEKPWWTKFSVGDIQQAITQLADGYRAVATLFLFEDYSHDEIAASLNISVATSRSQLSRAKEKIRVILMEQQR